jgi:hypothetical protein
MVEDIQTKYLEGGDIWVAYSKSLDVSVIGKTEKECIDDINQIEQIRNESDTHSHDNNRA